MSTSLFIPKYLPVLLLSLSLVGLAVVSSDTAYLNIDMTSQEQNFIQIFWTGKDGHYSTERTSILLSKEGRNTYSIPLENTFFIDKVRVDPQQGLKGKIPKPVEIHSMEYSFKWLFRSRQLDTEIEKNDAVTGMERGTGPDSNTIVFTDEDPQFEFEMRMHPIAYQLYLPICAFLGMHFLLSHYLLKGKKNRYLLEVVIGSDHHDVLQNLLSILKRKELHHRLLSSTLAGNLMRVQLQIDIQSAVLLRMLLQDPAVKKHLRSSRCYAVRSGEVS